jgi:hypothetical protein
VLAATDVIPLTELGVAFMGAGAVVVTTYAVLEFLGLRRLRKSTAARTGQV